MPITRKYERDIDLLLAEEFWVSPAFAKWFLRQTKFKEMPVKVEDIFVSQADASGESDLVVIFQDLSTEKRIALLIEDKIDAGFQPDQQARYRVRGDDEVQAGSYSDYEIVLCAPKFYYDAQIKAQAFERFISYESIADWLQANDTSLRGQYRSEFIRTAATKHVNAWERVDDEATNLFWAVAHKIASQEFPILELKERELTKGSTWRLLRPRDFPTGPKGIYIYLKGSRGQVDLTFENTRVDLLHDRIKTLLSNEFTIHQTGKSSALRLTCKPFTTTEGSESGIPKIRDAFALAERLIRFYRENRDALDKAAQES